MPTLNFVVSAEKSNKIYINVENIPIQNAFLIKIISKKTSLKQTGFFNKKHKNLHQKIFILNHIYCLHNHKTKNFLEDLK